MQALVIQDGTLTLAQRPVPAVEGEVLIRIRIGGICNTDLELVRGYYDYQGIPGHEFVGEVIDGPAALRGQRVVGEINVACGTCDLCLAGVPSHCRHRTTLGIRGHAGVFAEYATLPARNLYVVPENVPDRQAIFTEPLAAALQVMVTAHIRPTDRVLVLGAGKLGLLVAQVLRLSGCDLAVVVRHASQANLLARWGIVTARAEALPDAQADVVVDCTGRQEGFADALRLLRPRGTLVLKSTYADLPQANLSQVAVQEIVVVGSRCGPFDAALRLLRAGLVDVEALIEAEYPLADGLAAFECAAQSGRLKVLLTMNG